MRVPRSLLGGGSTSRFRAGFAAAPHRRWGLSPIAAAAAGSLILGQLFFLSSGDLSIASACAQGSDLARSQIGAHGTAAGVDRHDILEPGRPLERSIAGGEALSFQLDLSADQFLHLVVEQRGIDLRVALYGPDGEKVAEADSPNDELGPEPLVLMSRQMPGRYRLEVSSLDPDSRPGSFEAKVVELRPAVPLDESRIAAQDLSMAARSLRELRTDASQRAALDKHEAARALWRSVGDHVQEAHSLHSLGLIYGDVGEYQKALDAYRRAQALYGDLDDLRGVANILNNLGWTYNALGENQAALDFYEQALATLRAAGEPDRPLHLSNIAAAHAKLGDYRRALDLHLEVLALRRAVNDRRGQAITLHNIGNCYDRLGDKPLALRYYGLALELMPELGNEFYTAGTLNLLGALWRELGDQQKALDHLERALLLRRKIGDATGEAATLYEMARLESDRGELDAARGHIESALAVVESLRTKLASQQLRASFFATGHRYHELYVDMLMRLHRERPGEGFEALALEASERARARSLLELLSEAQAGIRHGLDPALTEREAALRQKLSARAEGQMRMLGGAHTDAQAAAAAEEVNALTIELEQVQAQIRQTSPRYAALTEPVPLTLREIQNDVLDEQTLLLEYALGEERSFLWAVTPTSIDSFELPAREEIETTARRLYAAVTARNETAHGETPEQRRQRLERADSDYPEAAAALSQILLGPVSDRLGTRRLLTVAEGVLQYTPFAALPVPGAAGAPSLVLDHEIVTLPSASVLAVLRRESRGRRTPDRTLAVLADPVFSTSDPRVSLAAASRESGPGGAPALEEARRSAEESGLADLVRLRFSRLEAEEIARLAESRATLVALDFSASRALATSTEIGRYRIVHFATHGLLNSRHPELSGVVLSLVDEQGRLQNGFLRLYDVYNLELNADLVVLSACQTALGREVSGEGLIGLTRGFMYAGAPRVVATLWRIDDRATAELMRRFYQGILRQDLRPAAALRAAQASMLQETKWRAPHYWAGFTFQGEWR